jgi:hypothetical protein
MNLISKFIKFANINHILTIALSILFIIALIIYGAITLSGSEVIVFKLYIALSFVSLAFVFVIYLNSKKNDKEEKTEH